MFGGGVVSRLGPIDGCEFPMLYAYVHCRNEHINFVFKQLKSKSIENFISSENLFKRFNYLLFRTELPERNYFGKSGKYKIDSLKMVIGVKGRHHFS